MSAASDDRPATRERSRAIYEGPWRIDLTMRHGVAPILSGAALARLAARALEAARAPSPASVGLILASDAELAALNEVHMGEHGPTDVLSFPLLPPEAFPMHSGKVAPTPAGPAVRAFVLPPSTRVHLGDIVISVDRVIAQAQMGHGGHTGDVRSTPAAELALLVTHGVLHITGWDHADVVEERAMRALERELLAREEGRAERRARTRSS